MRCSPAVPSRVRAPPRSAASSREPDGATMKLASSFLFVTVLALAVSAPQAQSGAGGQRSTGPTFNDVAPILYENCASCHRAGEVAPFSLLSYQDAAKRARMIATVTAARVMPPWKPEPDHGTFLNERRLTDGEIALLKAWA